MALSVEEIRRHILIALFSDDELMRTLVLKGGNALALVHKVGSRASVDLDFSIEEPFPDLAGFVSRIFATLKREFEAFGYVVFYEKCEVKPQVRTRQPEWWGGYIVQFKLVERNFYQQYGHDIDAVRRRAEVVGPQQMRTYTIDISHHEFCEACARNSRRHSAAAVFSASWGVK